MELAEGEKRRSQTTPNVSLPPSLLDGPQGDAPESGGRSDEPLRRQPHTISGAEGTRHEVRRAGKKGLMNGTERPKRSAFQRLAGRRRGKKETFIRSADFDHIGQKDSSSSDEGDDDCVPDEVGRAKGSEFRSLLLFIPLRLGQDKFNMEYKEAIKVQHDAYIVYNIHGKGFCFSTGLSISPPISRDNWRKTAPRPLLYRSPRRQLVVPRSPYHPVGRVVFRYLWNGPGPQLPLQPTRPNERRRTRPFSCSGN